MSEKKVVELYAARDHCGEIGLFTKKPRWIGDEDEIFVYVSSDDGDCFGCVTEDIVDVAPGQCVKVRIEIERIEE